MGADLGATIVQTQAKQALINMGWHKAVARAAVAEAAAELPADVTLQALVVAALRRCPSRATVLAVGPRDDAGSE